MEQPELELAALVQRKRAQHSNSNQDCGVLPPQRSSEFWHLLRALEFAAMLARTFELTDDEVQTIFPIIERQERLGNLAGANTAGSASESLESWVRRTEML